MQLIPSHRSKSMSYAIFSFKAKSSIAASISYLCAFYGQMDVELYKHAGLLITYTDFVSSLDATYTFSKKHINFLSMLVCTVIPNPEKVIKLIQKQCKIIEAQ